MGQFKFVTDLSKKRNCHNDSFECDIKIIESSSVVAGVFTFTSIGQQSLIVRNYFFRGWLLVTHR